MAEVSIIINCLNEEDHLRETLDSVFAQTFQDWEVVFWDNASTDGSAEIANSYGDKARYFRGSTTLPLGHARNLAFAQCQGKYVAILDADDLWLANKLERQLDLFRANPQLGMTFCDSMYFDDGGDRYRLFQLTKPHQGIIFGHLLEANFIFSSSMLFRKDAIDRLDYAFDERYSQVADWDLSLRVTYCHPADYVDEPLSKWRMYDMGKKPWRKSLVSQPAEARSALDNLIRIYPDIKDRYAPELDTFNLRFNYNMGMIAWQNGDVAEARRHLSRHLNSKKFALAYASTFLISHHLFNKARNLYRNRVTGRS